MVAVLALVPVLVPGAGVPVPGAAPAVALAGDAIGSCFNSSPRAIYPYGATDVNAEVGNSDITATLSPAGRVTVFRYAGANDENQVDFFASGYNPQNGKPILSAPNQGLMLGIRYFVDGMAHFAWLVSWAHSQRYASPESPTVITSYSSPAGLGLKVNVTTFASAGPLSSLDRRLPGGAPDALEEAIAVRRASGSPAAGLSLVSYGNWNPIASDLPGFPVLDSGCAASLDTSATGSYGSHAGDVVVSWKGTDIATGRQASVAIASGWSTSAQSWQVGGDGTSPSAKPMEPADGYSQLVKPPFRLGDASSASGHVTAALATKLHFSREGTARARFIVTAATSGREATDRLMAARKVAALTQLTAVQREWQLLLSRAPMPATSDKAVGNGAYRALISVLLAIDPRTGAIIASPDTQGPYGEDWIRDGSFINFMLDTAGFHRIVTQHNLFYARTQSSPAHRLASVPYGDWPMNMYPTGQPGGPISYEIDETGFGAWTLWSHAAFLAGAARRTYLKEVFPAIARAAQFLTTCVDPRTHLQCPASIGDNPDPSVTLQGAGPDLLGLRSAIAAARAVGVSGGEVQAWRSRAAELGKAIAGLYSPSAGNYLRAPLPAAGALRSPGSTGFEDGGVLLWPVHLLPYQEPQMQHLAGAVYNAMAASFSGASGGYETVQLLGACHAWQPLDPLHRQTLQAALVKVIGALSTPAGLLGEYWRRWGNGQVGPLNDQPHTWESAAFYLDTLCVDGSRPLHGHIASDAAAGSSKGRPGSSGEDVATIAASVMLLLLAGILGGVFIRRRRLERHL